MQKYNCKNCGAELYWDAEVGALKCDYCEKTYKASDFEDNTLKHVDNKQNNRIYDNTNTNEKSNNMTVYKCSHCGAELITSNTTMATICVYCGRAISITSKSVNNFRPEQIIPFAVTKNKAMETYKKYTKTNFFTPKRFYEDQTVEKVQGLFVPFFLHDAKLNMEATLTGEIINTHRRGDDKVTNHDVYNIEYNINGTYENVPTDAAKQLNNELMDSIEPFDYSKIKNYNPAYMAGYFAEQYNDDKDDLLNRAKEKMSNDIKKHTRKDLSKYTTLHFMNEDFQYSNLSSKYVMLPIWLLNVDYNDKKYTYAINGETGKISGNLPISKLKVLGFSAALFFASQLLGIAINAIQLFG